MKRLTALLLTILFTLSACTAALAWSCPNCGTEGSGNFCAECGTKRPEETICPNCGTNYGDAKPNYCAECGTRLAEATPTPTLPAFLLTPTPAPATASTTAAPQEYLAISDSGVNITGIERLADGSVTISWVDLNSNPPYRARFIENTTGDFNTDYANNLVRLEAQDLTGLSYTYQYLVPGMSYWLTIVNADGHGVYIAYSVPEAEPFTDFTITPTLQPLMRISSGDETSDVNVSSFSSAEIGLQLCEHGLYIRLDFPTLESDVEYTAQMVITSPNGLTLTDSVFSLPFAAHETGCYRYWEFFNLAWYFDVLNRRYDTVPAGEYTVTLYLDGKLAADATFTVTE